MVLTNGCVRTWFLANQVADARKMADGFHFIESIETERRGSRELAYKPRVMEEDGLADERDDAALVLDVDVLLACPITESVLELRG
ncbi:hypothetical protein D9M72_622090 [compost metagenome]